MNPILSLAHDHPFLMLALVALAALLFYFLVRLVRTRM